jgi:Subtilase family/HYR domain
MKTKTSPTTNSMSRSLFRRRVLLIPLVIAVLALCLPFRVVLAAEPLSRSALRQIQAVEHEKAARTPAQNKMDSQFVYALKTRAVRMATRVAPQLQPDVEILPDGRVLVDITATVSNELLTQIRKLGGEVISSFAQFNAIRALVPLTRLEALAGRRDVRFIERAAVPITNTGSVDGEGDTTHRAIEARTVFGVTGAGVNFGVLSDSEDFLAASQALGDLGPVTVVATGVGTCGANPCTGEGTAMMEIVHDLAPGSPLFFATANGGQANMAANILALQAAGCNIIVDDVTYFAESPFQDGVIAQAVNTVSASNVLYFSSARNSGNLNDGTSSTWEGDFLDGGVIGPPITGTGRLHDFGGGTTFNTIAAGGSNRRADLFWPDPLGASTNDYDLFVLDSTGTTVVRMSTNPQTGTQDPYESVGSAMNPLNIGERIVIVQRTGAALRFLHLDTGRGRLTISTEGCVRGHNASGAANAFSVAATDVANSFPNPFSGGVTNPIETFSSDGPRRIFFDPAGNPITPGNFTSTGGQVLQKPDITGADGAMTSAAVPGFNPFFGTSAAAPHAAAIAALLQSYAPALTPAQDRTTLQSTALDIEAAGFDRDSGAGIVMAFQALNSVNPCTLTCPADITQGNDPDQCGAVVTYSPPSTSGFCGTVTCTPASGSFFPVGTTSVGCTSTTEASCSFNVTVNDTEPPNITSASVDPSVLWPPNHRMVNVTVSYDATDNCPLPPNSCTLTVTSNEPINGTGDGDTSPDWIVLDDHHVLLRAERAGNGNGRIYTNTITCTDSIGNSSSDQVEVTVPHDRGR